MGGLFYVEALPEVGELADVSGDAGFHAATVRRIRPGEDLTLSDGAGAVAECRVEEADRGGLRVRVLQRRMVEAPAPPVTVVQALPKSERSELAVELATEAGADAFVAWQAERCVARWDGARADKGLRRWRSVARAAAGQSRRAWVPPVDGVWGTAALVAWVAEQVAGGTTVLVLHDAAAAGLPDVAAAPALAVVVGPEGGITEAEMTALTGAGAVAARLGPAVLRTSTAAAVALGALGVLTPRWGSA
ncbi:16S rRNA (uracil(1498)-N(3))-methyltransferase [Mycolicibacter sinensis]|uniref:Ribosomal RNA small subunit methyltransferase E n=1 Tax=Mycolicibacter sinensis (strain JDM601) TaxID=875328 RepID=A0A1A2EDF6_MYCSD|nr:16S rRNA (uracil(1498)-N(3))-methyltransferase [Mycolicibacter sinensis]OBG02806.1 16S rRNA (uracil(1498)-N(3))-methyltransferase [Mycolicibacter sinensis]OBG09463.1 16S rRNA (uracil(1498)-N(3))-methyltransferase [Mycolicibacter sinensis]